MNNSNKIKCEDGVYRLLTQCTKHEGRWISNAEWLEITDNNTLPLFEPLKSDIKHRLATGSLQSVVRVQANTIQNKAKTY